MGDKLNHSTILSNPVKYIHLLHLLLDIHMHSSCIILYFLTTNRIDAILRGVYRLSFGVLFTNIEHGWNGRLDGCRGGWVAASGSQVLLQIHSLPGFWQLSGQAWRSDIELAISGQNFAYRMFGKYCPIQRLKKFLTHEI